MTEISTPASAIEQLDFLSESVPEHIPNLVDWADDKLAGATEWGIGGRRAPWAFKWDSSEASYLKEDIIDARERMLGAMQGQVVIDLGCGYDRSFQRLALEYGAAQYIGIDRDLTMQDDGTLRGGELGGKRELILDHYDDESLLVSGDLLDFLARLPDDFATFALNGIDGYILPENTDYALEVLTQLTSSTKVGGAILGVDSARQHGILHDVRNSPEFQTDEVRLGVRSGVWIFCYTKLK